LTLPRTAPGAVTEHRLTLGTYERDRLAEVIENLGDMNEDAWIAEVLSLTKALAMPVAVLTSAYLAYLGLVNMGLGVDELRNRFGETPFGRYTNRFGENIQRTHPLYRFLTWGFGGENPPIVPPAASSAVADFVEDLGEGLADTLADVVPDVSQGNEGEGGGGGSRSGIFGGSVFM
jgi:hypothetical protein